MAKDTKEELQRLEQELLAAEADKQNSVDDILNDEDLKKLLDDAPAPQVKNTDTIEISPKQISDQLTATKEKPLTGLIIAVLLLTAGVIGMVCWYLVRYLGAF